MWSNHTQGDLKYWGYEPERDLEQVWQGWDDPDVKEALMHYGLDTQKDVFGGLNVVDGWEHLKEKRINLKKYLVSTQSQSNQVAPN